MFRLLVMTWVLLSASACGQKGDLYLPERDSSELTVYTSSASENDSLAKA